MGNGLHWCLDVVFREDDSRVRMGHGPTNLAIINRFAPSLVKQDRSWKAGVKASRKRWMQLMRTSSICSGYEILM